MSGPERCLTDARENKKSENGRGGGKEEGERKRERERKRGSEVKREVGRGAEKVEGKKEMGDGGKGGDEENNSPKYKACGGLYNALSHGGAKAVVEADQRGRHSICGAR